MSEQPKLIPGEVAEFVVESYLSTVKTKSILIYTVTVLVFFAAILSLIILSIQVSVQSSAFIRPVTEISTIRSLVNGRLRESFVYENKSVLAGETLFIIESEILSEREKNLIAKIDEAKLFIEDYGKLLHTQVEINELQTPLLQQLLLNYKQKMFDATARFSKVKADYNRNKKLHQERVIADSEFENFQFELTKATNDMEQIKQSQLSQWQNELRSYEKEWLDLAGQLAQLQKEKENLSIKAPVSGNIQNLAGLYQGSLVFTNQDMAQISPDTSLLVEAYLNPNDIGLIQKGMSARFQVDAFNYNQWGVATGKVVEISSDIHIVNDKPVFKVKCILDKTFLQLRNGYKGYLKKGMSLQARFIVTERTLWQLLYDKVDDWVNPNTYVR
jgi:membrane fusion protein, peptide pheromone/bacteriocin exporter